MEYVEGGDCASLLKNMGPLPVDMARYGFIRFLVFKMLYSFWFRSVHVFLFNNNKNMNSASLSYPTLETKTVMSNDGDAVDSFHVFKAFLPFQDCFTFYFDL